MASIIKRKSKYSVVYYYTDEKGEKHQNGKPVRIILKQNGERRKLRTSRATALLSLHKN